jgi:hypothetical protein
MTRLGYPNHVVAQPPQSHFPLLSKDTQGKILGELTDADLGLMLFVSKSTHSEATRVLLERMQAVRVTFDDIHARLAEKYAVNCRFVKPDETLVEFSHNNAEEHFIFHGKLRVELKTPGRIEVVSEGRADDTWPLRVRRRLYFSLAEITETVHMVLLPRTKKRWLRSNNDPAFHLRPYPDDPATVVCNAFDAGMRL